MSLPNFTFYQLVRVAEGYALAPYITLYANMIEIHLRG